MNPKTPNNLDPKLREAYERIMSGTPTQAQPQQTPPQQTPQPQSPLEQTQQLPQTLSPFEQTQTKSPLEQSFTLNQPPQQENFPPPKMETQEIQTPSAENNPLTPSEQDITSSPLSREGAFATQNQNQQAQQISNSIVNG